MNIMQPCFTVVGQATETSALASVGGILLATWVIVATIKALLPELKGRLTLGVVLIVAILLTSVALFVTKSLSDDPITAFIGVLVAILGAAGIDAAGPALLKGQAKAKVLAPVALVLLLGGCSGVPGGLVVEHVDTVSPDHIARLEAAAEDPPRVIPASDAEVQTYRANWAATRAAGVSAGSVR